MCVIVSTRGFAWKFVYLDKTVIFINSFGKNISAITLSKVSFEGFKIIYDVYNVFVCLGCLAFCLNNFCTFL